MKLFYWLFLVVVWSACQHATEVNLTPRPEKNLTEIGENQLPVNFYGVYLAARTSVNSLTISSSVQFNNTQFSIQEFGFCLSQTDSLPRITSSQHKRISASVRKIESGYTVFESTITDLTADQIYYIDPYVILTDGRILYGRYNQERRTTSTSFSAISFQLPQRPPLQPVQFVSRASVPTPPGASNTSPIPSFHQFSLLNGRLYSFYPTGALQAYDADADRWEPMADLGRTVFGTSFLVFPVDNKLYVYSGIYGGTSPAPSMWEYDPAKNQWTNLGNSLGENLLQSRYQLSADGKAYFYSSYPYGVLAFDARQKRIDIVSKTNLLANLGTTNPYVLVDKDTYYNTVWAPGGSVAIPGSIRSRIIQYNLSSDRVTEATDFSTQLSKQHYNNTDNFLVAQGTDLLTGYGSTTNLILRPGSVEADGLLVKDELVRYSTRDRRITAYYDISGIPNSLSYSQAPIMVNNRLFIFNASTEKGILTEVIFK